MKNNYIHPKMNGFNVVLAIIFIIIATVVSSINKCNAQSMGISIAPSWSYDNEQRVAKNKTGLYIGLQYEHDFTDKFAVNVAPAFVSENIGTSSKHNAQLSINSIFKEHVSDDVNFCWIIGLQGKYALQNSYLTKDNIIIQKQEKRDNYGYNLGMAIDYQFLRFALIASPSANLAQSNVQLQIIIKPTL